VNERRTKYMIMSTSESRWKPQDLRVRRKIIYGSGFRYLGNMIIMTTEMITVLKKGYKLETGPIVQILEFLQVR
jgi:hypothetical protein